MVVSVPDAPHERAVEVRGLTKVFGEVVPVRDLSFTVLPGGVTGFLGPNGARQDDDPPA
jgi:ABC-type multidrug transport system ATPase subunit